MDYEINKDTYEPFISSIEWPIKIKDSIDLLFSHNDIIALWYSSSNEGLVRIWRGEAWSLPDEYNDIRILKFTGIAADVIWESDAINLIVDANDNTPRNIPKKEHDTRECADSNKQRG